MIKQSALLAALALASGCAHHSTESNRVVVSDRSSPYVAGESYRSTTVGGTTSYGTSYGTGIYGPSWTSDYDNTSKGAGARALMANPYDNSTTYYSGAPAGAAVAIGTDTEETTSKGAGARGLTQDTRVNDTATTGNVVATGTGATSTDADINSQGEGARALSGNDATVSYKDDATFVREAAQAGLAEVRMGELAQQNSGNEAMKDFGRRLVEDHRKANEELMSIAQQKNLQTPTSMSQRQQGMIDHLASLNGAEFDKDCGKHAVEAHEKAVHLFRAEAQSGKDADLKAFAQKTLPTLEDHLRMARELNKTARHE